ncbi:hypothetical protein HAX54_032034, partial [Datura stramonium]|nr:hypothetical protein [Datura stramonium]
MSFMEALAWLVLDLGERCRKKESSKEPSFSLSEEHIVKRKSFLNSCLVGPFVKWVGSPKAIRNWAAEEWGVAEGVKITWLNDTQFLFRFVSEDQAVKILNEGRRRHEDSKLCRPSDAPLLARLVFGENLSEKRGKVPVSIVVEDGVLGYRVWPSIEFRPSILQEDREGNIESGRRREGGFGGGRGRRVDLREWKLWESLLWQKGRRATRDRLNRFNYSNGSNRKESNASQSNLNSRLRFLGQTSNIDVPTIHRHPRRSDLGHRACDSHGYSLSAMGGQMKEVSEVPHPSADRNCRSGEKKPAGTALCEGCLGRIMAAGVSGSSGDLVLAGRGNAEAVEATPAQEMTPVHAGNAQLMPSDPEFFCSVGGRVRGRCSNSKSDVPTGDGAALQELQQINIFVSGCKGKEERVLDLLRDIEKEANGIREKESDDPREGTKMSSGKAKEGE